MRMTPTATISSSRGVPAARRGTLIAELVDDGVYRFDVLFQGDDETVFFDF